MLLIFVVLALLLLGLAACCFVAYNPFLRAVARTVFWLTKDALFGRTAHNKMHFPSCASEVTNPEWLTLALQPKFPGVRVLAVTATEMGADMGNASTMFRLQVEYEQQQQPGEMLPPPPSSMICKLPKAGWKSRIPFTAARMNEMEALFYASELNAELVSSPSQQQQQQGLVHFPRGFGGKYDARTGDCYSLFEDLAQSKCTFTREIDPIDTLERALVVVNSLGRFHGRFFDNKQRFATDLSWIVQQSDPVLGMTAVAFTFGWDKFIQRFGSRIPSEVRERGALLAPIAGLLHDYMGSAPQVIVHGDCHLENAYFTQAAGAELGLYDMQLMRIGRGALDLASFIGGSVAPELLGGGIANSDGEDYILQRYLDTVQRETNNGNNKDALEYVDELGSRREYTLADLQRDYKLALALLFVWNVSASLAIPFNTPAAHDYEEYALRLVASMHRTSSLNYALWFFSLPAAVGALGPAKLRGAIPKPDFWMPVPNVQRSIPGFATHTKQQQQEGAVQRRLHVAKLSPQTPQTLLDKWLWKPAKFAFLHSKTKSKQGYHGQKTTDVEHRDLEAHHSVEYASGTNMDAFALDSFYLSSFSSKHNFALRWCRRSLESKGEVWLVLRTVDDTLEWSSHPSTVARCFEVDEDTVCVENDVARMELTMLVPMKRWRVKFTGALRSRRQHKLVPVQFELVTESIMPHFAFGTHVDPALTAKSISHETLSRAFFDELKATHQEHYEQFCDVSGVLQIGGAQEQEEQVRGRGMRDRAFGCRQWSYMARYAASYLCCDNGMVISFVFASLPTLTNAKFGFVFGLPGDDDEQGQFTAIDAMSGDFAQIGGDGVPPKEWELAMRCANGTQLKIRAFVSDDDDGNSVGLDMGPGEMWIHLRFARFHVSYATVGGGVKETWGRGASEFGHRVAGCEPIRPTAGTLHSHHEQVGAVAAATKKQS